MIEQLSLMTDGVFVAPVIDPALWADLLDSVIYIDEQAPTVSISEPVVSEPEKPKGPPYREKEWMLAQAAGKSRCVGIFRSGICVNKNEHGEQVRVPTVSVVPLDFEAAALLLHYAKTETFGQVITPRRAKAKKKKKIQEADSSKSTGLFKKKKPTKSVKIAQAQRTDGSNPNYKVEDLLNPAKLPLRANVSKYHSSEEKEKQAKDHRIYFPLWNLVAADVRESFLVKHLEQAGFSVIVSPSLANYLPKMYRRLQRDLTAFDLPEVVDTRPLFERAETGTLLTCTKTWGPYVEGTEYIVVQGAQVVQHLEDGSEEANESETVKLKPTDAPLSVDPVEWSVADGDMEDVFTLTEGDKVIYDPAKSIPALFPDLFKQHYKKIEQLKLPIFDHTHYDAAQMAVKTCGVHGKPQRQGKTSEAIVTALVRGTKRNAFIGPSIGRPIVVDEMKRMGLDDYVVVKSVNDLEKKARFHLMTYSWLSAKRDPMKTEKYWDEKKKKFVTGYLFPAVVNCPHCQKPLKRLRIGMSGAYEWTDQYGYRCVNTDCSFTETLRSKWAGPKPKHILNELSKPHHHAAPVQDKVAVAEPSRLFQVGLVKRTPGGKTRSGGYVDYERAKHVQGCIVPVEAGLLAPEKVSFKKRQCTHCGYVGEKWVPPRYRRANKYRWGTVIGDEIHFIRGGTSSDRGAAMLSIRGKHHQSMTGTLMPNGPSDPYWPLHWTLRGGTDRFPYFRNWELGKGLWDWEYVSKMEIVKETEDGQKKKYQALPYLARPRQYWELMARSCIRRDWNDPLVLSSLEKLGLKHPEVGQPRVIMCTPDVHQSNLLLNVMDAFQKYFESYKQKQEKANKELSKATTFASMSLMRIAATCPDLVNEKLEAVGCPAKPYKGSVGGAKMTEVFNLVWSKVQKGEKVVVYAYHKRMVELLADQLSMFNPVRFDTKWNEETRFEWQKKFNDPDSGHNVFICTLDAVQVAVDLSGAETVICTDLLWVPGNQDQAIKRIMKPVPGNKVCEVYYILLKHSIDEHIYNVFYSKLVAAEQAMDRQVKTKKDRGFNVQWFVDKVLADRAHIVEYLVEAGEEPSDYVQTIEMLWQDDRE